MADLIDRKNLINNLREDVLVNFGGFKNLRYVLETINNLPPADTERHAHWIEEYLGFDYVGYKCSECGRIIRVNKNISTIEDYPYCHCGCKMDEVIE